MSALDLVISRLQKRPRKAPAKSGIEQAYRAQCPVCAGHGMPLSLAETADGRLLLHCFGRCEAEAVLTSLGLVWGDVLPQDSHTTNIHGNGGPAAWGALAAGIDALHQAHCDLLAASSLAMQTGEIEAALRAYLDAGEAAQQIKVMARIAMRGPK